MTGTMGILNVGAGDTKLVFDPANPAECIRAARIVKDMIRRGYALLIEVKDGETKTYRRVLDFDDKVFEYIIADFDPIVASQVDATEIFHEEGQEEARGPAKTGSKAPAAKAPRGRTKSVPASKTRGVAVARSAGG